MFRKLEKEMESDIRAAKKIRLPWWAVLSLLALGMPLPWLFDHFGKLNLFLPAFNAVLVVVLVIIVKFNLRRHAWFWGTMVALAALHVIAILLFPWTSRWVPALAIAAIDSGDFVVMIAIIAVVGRVMENPKAAGSDSAH